MFVTVEKANRPRVTTPGGELVNGPTAGGKNMITVIGAGLGGLTLAAVLHAHDVEVAVYDADASPTARHQGGMLDMHEDSGQAALRDAGLFQHFRQLILPGGDAMRILDKHATVRMADDGNGERP